MTGFWDRHIRRAEQLAAQGGPAASLLAFYARLLPLQQAVYDSLGRQRPSGSLTRDLSLLRPAVPPLLRMVAEHGPDQLVIQARTLIDSADSAIDDVLVAYWRAPSDREFFAKAILQPYGQRLAEAGIAPIDGCRARADNRCPRCGGAPQVSILDTAGSAAGDGGSRRLLCAGCLTTWPFRRVLCPGCGEEDERKLGYFRSEALGHVRVDACDSCRHYTKTIDLGHVGLAVPLVDEVGGAPLDLWAREHGYEKIELNLVGL